MRSISFEDFQAAVELPEILQEYLTYDKLFRMSEPKRGQRSLTVKMPPMEMQQYQTPEKWVFEYYFNAKGNPSTTGLRHRGYVRFLKPKKTQGGKMTPLSQLNVECDCGCPDYRYVWAWANHQRQAGPIGRKSINQCINKAPKIKNPSGAPGLCKHLLATRDYIYGLLSGFPAGTGDTQKLDALTKKATKRWLNFDAEMEKARQRDALIAASKARRNVGLPPEQQNRPIAAIPAEEPPDLPLEEPVTPVTRAAPPPPPPSVKPKKAPPTKPVKRGTATKPAKPTVKPGAKLPPPLSPEAFSLRHGAKIESVDSRTNMKTLSLQESRAIRSASKLIEELEDEIQNGDSPVGLPDEDGTGELPPPSGENMPVEPPVSDSAVGASTEDNVALSLLREIRDLLAELSDQKGGSPGEEDMPDLPPEGEGEEGEGNEEGTSEEEGEQFRPGKRPMSVPSGVE